MFQKCLCLDIYRILLKCHCFVLMTPLKLIFIHAIRELVHKALLKSFICNITSTSTLQFVAELHKNLWFSLLLRCPHLSSITSLWSNLSARTYDSNKAFARPNQQGRSFMWATYSSMKMPCLFKGYWKLHFKIWYHYPL